MNRRDFILGALISVFMIGCSSKLETRKEISLKNFYQIDKFYYRLQDDFKKSTIKFSKLGSFLNSSNNVGIKHSLPWFYGVNPALSKSDILIKKEISSGFLELGFGFKNSKEFYLNLYNEVDSLDNNSNKLGFKNFNELFNYIYLNISTSNKYVLATFLNDLYVKGYIDIEDIMNINNDDLIVKYTNYDNLTEEDLFIEINGYKIQLDYYDFTMYSTVIKICGSLIENSSLGKII